MDLIYTGYRRAMATLVPVTARGQSVVHQVTSLPPHTVRNYVVTTGPSLQGPGSLEGAMIVGYEEREYE